MPGLASAAESPRPSRSVSKIASIFGGSVPVHPARPRPPDMAAEAVHEAKSRFSSTKAMFQSLERTNGSPEPHRLVSPQESLGSVSARGTVSAPFLNGHAAGKTPPMSARELSRGGPPPLPPKPRAKEPSRLDSELSSLIADSQKALGEGAEEPTPREDSPLTEMTKRFNDLVSDLEGMAPTPASPRPAERYPHTISLTQSLNMDKGPAKPASLYEPYWRNQSWVARRYGMEASTSVEHGPDESRPAAPSTPPVPAKVTTYALFRTNKAPPAETTTESETKSDADVSSKDSGVGGSLDEQAPAVRRRSSPLASPPASDRTSAGDAVVDFMTREEQTVLLSPASRPEPSSALAAITPKPFVRPPTTNGTHVAPHPVSNGTHVSPPPTANGTHMTPLPPFIPPSLHIPQDESLKRLSAASIESSQLSSEHHEPRHADGQLLSPRRYSLSKDVNWLEDGNFWVEVAGLGAADEDALPPDAPFHDPVRVSFSAAPIKVFSTHSETEYDRRNADIDPISASAEYELERRLEKMHVFDVTVHKGDEGLGFSIIGMGVGADAGLEKLGIFVKSITPGGAVHKNGLIHICDQIVEVDGSSLVGVTQSYAANILRSTNGSVNFKIGREKSLESSEIALLIRQSLEQDRVRNEQQRGVWAPQGQESGSEGEGSSTTPVPTTPSDCTPRTAAAEDPITPTELLPHSLPQIDSLITQLRQDEEDEDEDSDEDEAPTPPPSLPHGTPPEAFRSEPPVLPGRQAGLDPQMSAFLQNSLQQPHGPAFATNPSPLRDAVVASPVRRNGAEESLSPTGEASIRASIRRLESEMAEIRSQASRYQSLLSSSQAQCEELERKYGEARGLLADYQARERDLLEREESHLAQLREKDAHYSSVVHQMRDKVGRLEQQLGDQQAKRTSVVEAQLSELQAQLAKEVERKRSVAASGPPPALPVHIPSTPSSTLSSSHPSSHHSDISPAQAYQPAAKKAPSHKTMVHVSNSLDSAGEGSSDALPVPFTQPLDSSLLKAKSEAVRQSQMMSSRNLPSRRGEIEVLDICHHHEGHTHSLRVPYSAVGPETPDVAGGSMSSTSTPSAASAASPATPRRPHAVASLFKKAAGPKELAMARDAEIVHALDVLHWSCDDVCRFLKALGLEKYIPEFTVNKVDGGKFLQLDGTRLKAMGVGNHTDRAVLKKRVKDVKTRIEKERKAIEKESRSVAKADKRSTSKRR